MKTYKRNKAIDGLGKDIKNKIKKSLSFTSSRCLLIVSPFYDKAHIELLDFTSKCASSTFLDSFSLSYQNIKLNTSIKYITENIINDLSIFSNKKSTNPKKKEKVSIIKCNHLSYTLQIKKLENELSKFKKNIVILDNFEEFINGPNSKFLYSYLSLLESNKVNLFTIFITKKVFGTEQIEKRCRSRLSIDKVFIGDVNKTKSDSEPTNLLNLTKGKRKQNMLLKPADLNENNNYFYLSQLEKIVLVFLLIEIKQKETPTVFDVHLNIIESYKSTHLSKTIGNFPYKLIEKIMLNMEIKGIVYNKHKSSLSWDKDDEVTLLGLKSLYVELLHKDIEKLPLWVHNFIKLI